MNARPLLWIENRLAEVAIGAAPLLFGSMIHLYCLCRSSILVIVLYIVLLLFTFYYYFVSVCLHAFGDDKSSSMYAYLYIVCYWICCWILLSILICISATTFLILIIET